MLKKSDYRYFSKAEQVAELSDFRKTHIGCIAVYQGRVIGIGYNVNKTHPLQQYYNKFRITDDNSIHQVGAFVPKLHAEISCINSIRHLEIDFSKVKLYIYRIRKDNPYGLSRPCPSCMAAIKDLGIKHIYYTTNDGYAYEKIERVGAA